MLTSRQHRPGRERENKEMHCPIQDSVPYHTHKPMFILECIIVITHLGRSLKMDLAHVSCRVWVIAFQGHLIPCHNWLRRAFHDQGGWVVQGNFRKHVLQNYISSKNHSCHSVSSAITLAKHNTFKRRQQKQLECALRSYLWRTTGATTTTHRFHSLPLSLEICIQ